MKEKIRSLCVLLTLLATTLPAQTWRGDQAVAVQVNDSKGHAVASARVVFTFQGIPGETGPDVVATDSKGRAVMAEMAPGPWQVEISHPEYLSYIAMVDVRRGKKPLVSASFLEAGGRSLSPVKVKFTKGHGQPASPVIEARRPAENPVPAAPVAEERAEPVAQIAEAPAVAPPPPPPVVADPAPAEPELMPDPEPESLPESAPEPESVATIPPEAAPEVEAVPPPEAPMSEPEPETQPVTEPEPTPAVAAVPSAELEAVVEEEAPMREPEPAPEPAAEPEPAPILVTETSTEVEAVAAEETPAPEPEPMGTSATQPAPEMEPSSRDETPMPEPEPAALEPAIEPEVVEAEAPAPQPTVQETVAEEVRTPPTVSAPLPEPTPAPEPTHEPQERREAVAEQAARAPTVPTAPAAAVAAIPPPPETGVLVTSHSDGSCTDCESAEWTLQVSVPVPARDSSSAGACGGEILEVARAAMLGMSTSIQLELDGFIGPVADGTPQEAVRRIEPELAAAFTGELAPYLGGNSPCQIVGLVLPKAVRFSRLSLTASDRQGAGGCPTGQLCSIGDALWVGAAYVERGSSATVVYGLFENRSNERGRRAIMTAYYRPPNANWKPRIPAAR